MFCSSSSLEDLMASSCWASSDGRVGEMASTCGLYTESYKQIEGNKVNHRKWGSGYNGRKYGGMKQIVQGYILRIFKLRVHQCKFFVKDSLPCIYILLKFKKKTIANLEFPWVSNLLCLLSRWCWGMHLCTWWCRCLYVQWLCELRSVGEARTLAVRSVWAHVGWRPGVVRPGNEGRTATTATTTTKNKEHE